MYDFVLPSLFFAHRALERDTSRLVSLAQQAGEFNREQTARFRRWYQFYWEMMEQHHLAEDDVVFVEIEKRLNQPSEVIEQMETEHNRLQFLIDEIKRLIRELERNEERDLIQKDLLRLAVELQELLHGHICREEEYVVTHLKTYFTPEAQRRLDLRVKRKAPWGYVRHLIPWMQASLNPEENKELNRTLPWFARLLNRFLRSNRYLQLEKSIATWV